VIKKLRLKFILINMSIVAVMLCVIFGTVLHFTQQRLEADSISAVSEIALQSSQFPMRPGESPSSAMRQYFTLRISPAGAIYADGSSGFDLSDEDYLLSIAELCLSSGEQTGILKDYSLRYYISSSPMGAEIAFIDISSDSETMAGLWKSCILIGALSLVAFFGISVLLSRWAAGPVKEAFEQQRQFVADASHELKTRLTVIMTNAELLQGSEQPEELKERSVFSILTMSHQMRGLVEDLLELARLDNGSSRAEKCRLDYSKLMNDALLPFEPVFFEKGLTLECSIEDGISVFGSDSQLTQIAGILLDNAQKYCTAGGRVSVKLCRGAHGRCVFAVSSDGDELSPEDRKNIFKRFYRTDKSRSDRSSYGLGLPIAASIAANHRGRIRVESSGGVNTFFVELPAV